jgi:hypothetical protein
MIGIAADPDARRLADSGVGHRLDRLVGERPGATDDADPALAMDRAGMIPTLAEPGEVRARAVRPDQRRACPPDDFDRGDHVERGDALGDAEDRRDPRRCGLHHRIRRAAGRDEDAGRVRDLSRGSPR